MHKHKYDYILVGMHPCSSIYILLYIAVVMLRVEVYCIYEWRGDKYLPLRLRIRKTLKISKSMIKLLCKASACMGLN